MQNPSMENEHGDALLTWQPSGLPWFVALEPAMGGDQERSKAGTIITQPTLTVTGPWRADITTSSRLIDADGRALYVVAVNSPDRRKRELVLQCSSVEPTSTMPYAEWMQPDWMQSSGWCQ